MDLVGICASLREANPKLLDASIVTCAKKQAAHNHKGYISPQAEQLDRHYLPGILFSGDVSQF